MKYSKLTQEQIEEIKIKSIDWAQGFPTPSKKKNALAAEYNVTVGRIQKIVNERAANEWEIEKQRIDAIKTKVHSNSKINDEDAMEIMSAVIFCKADYKDSRPSANRYSFSARA